MTKLLSPTDSTPWKHQMSAILHALDGRAEAALQAVAKLQETRPFAVTARDAIGEVLLMTGRMQEAETAFREIAPRYWHAWTGVAQSKFLRGDWDAGRAILADARRTARTQSAKLQSDVLLAWSHLAQGSADEAAKVVDRLESEAAQHKIHGQHVWAALVRTVILGHEGKHAAAILQLDEALRRARTAGLLDVKRGYRSEALRLRIWNEARLADAAAAAKTLREIEAAAKRAGADAPLRFLVAFGRGALALAQGDASAALRAFAACHRLDVLCQWERLRAQTRVGDASGAAATRDRLLRANLRQPMYTWVRARVLAESQPQK